MSINWSEGTINPEYINYIPIPDLTPDGRGFELIDSRQIKFFDKLSVRHLNFTPFIDGVNDLDDIPDGTSYARVLSTAVSSGLVLLDQASGDLDDITDGATYARVLSTDISAGHVLLSAVTGDLDDVSDGTNYGKVLLTSLSAGSILLAQATGDLDDIADGTNYGKVALTSISAGKIIVAGLDSGVTARMFSDSTTQTNIEAWRHASDVTLIDGGDIYTGSVTTTQLNFTPVQDTNVIASINASAEGITIDADNITISGSTTFSSGYDPTDKVDETGGSYASAASGARVLIFPDANTGIQIIDNVGNDVLKALVGGTDIGDVIIGDYVNDKGMKWDKSASAFFIDGRTGGRQTTTFVGFGSGIDGDVTISSNTSLTSDMYYDNLTINATYTLTTNGYRIFVRGTLTNNGTIRFNGNDGSDGGDASLSSAGTAGSGGAGVSNGTIRGSLAGSDGAAGKLTGGESGNNGVNGTAENPSLGNNGAAGGGGGDTTSETGGSGGSAGTATAETLLYDFDFLSEELTAGSEDTTDLLLIYDSIIGAGRISGSTMSTSAGSGGGGSGPVETNTGADATGGGGGGGATGGCIFIAAKTLDNSGGTIEANGGNGGNGGNPFDAYADSTPELGGSGGGGAGSGGIIVLFYESFTSGTETVNAGSAGSGSTGLNGGTSGANGLAGNTGKIYKLKKQ